MRLITFFLLYLGLASALPQNFLSDIKSALGFGDDDPEPTTSTSRTLARPTTNSATSTRTTRSSSHTDSITSTITRSTRPSRTTDSSTSDSTSTESDTSTITSEPTTSTTPPTPPPPPPPSSTAGPIPPAIPNTSNSNSQSSSVPASGIAVAIIMTLAVLAAIAWLLFRYHPGIRARWLARQEKKQQERSYRAALDGPFASSRDGGSSPGAHGPNLAGRKSMLASFFAPRTVKLGNGREIRRKPVNWGAGAAAMPATRSPAVAELPGSGFPMEKVALTDMAAPMARTESTKSGVSYTSGLGMGIGGGGSSVSSVTTGSNRSSPAITQKELPPMPPIPLPPVPAVPVAGGRDVHRILSRKSIYELA